MFVDMNCFFASCEQQLNLRSRSVGVCASRGKFGCISAPSENNTMICLNKGGITTSLQMRYASPKNLKAILLPIFGFYCHCHLNFVEVDFI